MASTPTLACFRSWAATLCLSLIAIAPLAAADFAPKGLSPRPDTKAKIERLRPEFDALLAPGAVIEILAEGFNWSEGPVWAGKHGGLLFSDVPENKVYRWSSSAGLSVFLEPSGFTGEVYRGRERGANGLTLDQAGRLTLCQHGDRRVAQLADDGRSFTTLADRFEGKRFSSPNDLCFNRAGQLFFTDPPYGLPQDETPALPQNGVYRRNPDGSVALITASLERPNGIALSVDQRTLYVANSHGPRPLILAIQLSDKGEPTGESIFFDGQDLIARTQRGGLFDGLKVDGLGNLWATGPGGVLILSPRGEHLGSILTGRATANCAFGDEDHGTLYITADEALLRVRTLVRGISP